MGVPSPMACVSAWAVCVTPLLLVQPRYLSYFASIGLVAVTMLFAVNALAPLLSGYPGCNGFSWGWAGTGAHRGAQLGPGNERLPTWRMGDTVILTLDTADMMLRLAVVRANGERVEAPGPLSLGSKPEKAKKQARRRRRSPARARHSRRSPARAPPPALSSTRARTPRAARRRRAAARTAVARRPSTAGSRRARSASSSRSCVQRDVTRASASSTAGKR